MAKVSQGIPIVSVRSVGKNISLMQNTQRRVMNTRKVKIKKAECLSHRQAQYDKALDGVIEGDLPPEYLNKRWEKLKAIKGR